ncbi:DNA primase family protein [Pseudarthrobacter sp. LMD1-1-1.1]|uniref:DNA primase family protein n=1 Tax=Pseudarthrobacter sp. LMD1-1-1.1 TaxID=3135242 RepID=UPI00343C7924
MAEKTQLIKLQTAEYQKLGGITNASPAQREDIKDKALARIHAERDKASIAADTAAEDISLHRGQARLAYRLAEHCEGKMLYVSGIGWHYYDGRKWQEDTTGRATRYVLAILRKALADSLDHPDLRQDVRKCESAAGIEGVLKIARSLPPFATTTDQLDADPYLLNTRNGTLDLHTLQLRPHDPADRITRCTAAAWDPNAAGPVWEAFLARVLPDPDVRGFLQRFCGLTLAGKVLEHILAIYTGKGRNGKSVCNQAFSTTLGDYAITAEPDLFLHRDGAHPTGTMDLLGCRYAAVSESDKDRQLAEATVKQLTGGDRLRARRLYQNFTEFNPSHTPVLITNHLPKVSGDDAAIWARLRVVPFDVVIPDAEQDPHLAEKLELELDAILAWAVEGWQAYQEHGLGEAAAVVAATESYHSDADALGRFISEECDTGPGYSTLTETLHRAWSGWAIAEDVPPMTKRSFGLALEQRGYEARKGGKGVRYRAGIQPKPVQTAFGDSGDR